MRGGNYKPSLYFLLSVTKKKDFIGKIKEKLRKRKIPTNPSSTLKIE